MRQRAGSALVSATARSDASAGLLLKAAASGVVAQDLTAATDATLLVPIEVQAMRLVA
ncbi:MAG: hypothetical protein ABWY07_04925 [Burkholderiales bacterium]